MEEAMGAIEEKMNQRTEIRENKVINIVYFWTKNC